MKCDSKPKRLVALEMKSIDLFCGAGGLSCGLKMAGFDTILANELKASHAETFKHNHPDSEVVIGDIRQLCAVDLKKKLKLEENELDLVAGGPPCQGFSVNAPIRDLDDERNHLFKDFLRVAFELMPKAILIENVPGIVSLGKGTVVEQIYKELESRGYKVEHRILYAGHYGVPQLRFRTIILGVKNRNKEIYFPQPQYDSTARANFAGAKELCLKLLPLFASELKKQTTVWDALSDLPPIHSGTVNASMDYETSAQGEYQKYLRKNSEKVTNHSCNGLGPVNLERLKYIPQGGSWRDIPHDMLPKGLKRARRSDHTKRYGRLSPDSLCSTILTKCDPHWGSFFHPTQDRVLSVREAARIQSFPDHYTFLGSLQEQYEQVGNAVPPLMAKAIGEEIKKMIEEN